MVEEVRQNAVADTLEDLDRITGRLGRRQVLFVDDEGHILRAVRRLLDDAPYELLTCESGEEAKRVLEEENIAVLISDQRMPGISGAELLQFAANNFPDTVRIMLTGNNDVRTAMEAINRGAVFRFVTKPWESDAFHEMVDRALEHHELLTSRSRYEAYIARQNETLQRLNEELESRVAERTAELVAKQEEVVRLYQELQKSFDATIRVLLSIMELGEIHVVEHCRRTAERVQEVGKALKMKPRALRDLERAARLHWLGLINAPASIFQKEVEDFDAVEQATWEFHPLLGQQAIQHVPELVQPGRIILHYLSRYDDPYFRVGEDFDESGPLTEELITSCQVLAMSSCFERLRTRLGGQSASMASELVEEGIARVVLKSGRQFSPDLVAVFTDIATRDLISERTQELGLEFEEVRAGMVLSRPLQTLQGIPVAPRDMIVTDELLERLRRFRDSRALSMIYVWR